jgi:cellulose synthase operon protein C
MELLLPDVVKRLEQGDAPDAILASFAPVGERELLKRAAVVRTFDRPLFDTVLAGDVSGRDLPSFEEFVKAHDIEPLPREKAVFQIRRGARRTHWQAWWAEDPDGTSIPGPLRRFLKELVEYYEKAQNPVEVLAHLALLDEPGAHALFVELFRSADQRFDLAGCQDLIDVLSDPERASFIGADLVAAREDRAAYLGARSLWSTEYYKTESFLEPEGVRATFEALFEGRGARVLDLHAPGGRGKTMQLRWLIARQLVPEVERVPGHPFGNGRIACAKVDFDFIDPVNATRYPWLVLLEAAAQLNDQMPKKWFNELLDTAGWAIPLLRRNPADPSRAEAASKRVGSEGVPVGDAAVRGFWKNLNEAAETKPVLLVLDTLEEVHLRPQGDLVALLSLLGEMLDRCPGLRLILSGRYSVSEIVGDAVRMLPPMQDVPVHRFSPVEASRYLEERRGLPEQSICRAVVKKADGDPMLLSLLADEIQARPNLTAAEIERYPAEVIRLIKRIVSRIREPEVRWILRYGVVPRALTLEFVRDVMQPHLRQSMAGERSLDDPAQDELPVDSEQTAAPFPSDVLASPAAPLDLEELWTALRRYAGSTSWVFPDPDNEEILRFRADVAVPMRTILRRHRVFRRLHRDAAAYFEQRAEKETNQWVRWTREAIYHHFQLQGPSAARVWRRALENAGLADPERRAALAAELLEPDYVDKRRAPLAWEGDKTIVDQRTLIEAQFEQGKAQSELARMRDVPRDDQLWSAAEESLAAVERGQAELGRRVIPAAGVAYLRAGLALKDGRIEEAEKELTRAARTAKEGPDTARLLTLLGDAELERGNRAAPERYAAARSVTPRSDRGQLAELDVKLALSQLQFDRLDEAYKAQRRGLSATRSPEQRAQLLLLGALIGLGAGQLTWAEEAAAAALAQGGDWYAWTPRVTAALARFEPLHARDLAVGADDAAGTAAAGALDPSRQAALARQLAGFCAGELMEFDVAFGALETARSLWQSLGDAEGVAQCHARAALLKLHGVGDIRTCEHHLREAEQFPQLAGSEAWLDVRLVHTELHWHMGAENEARALVRATIEELREAHAAPRRLIRAAVAGLHTAEADERLWLLDLVLKQCRLMTPASARIVALRGMRDVPELREAASRERLAALRSLLRLGSSSRLTPIDRGVLNLTLAEVDRVAGKRAAAVRRLETAREQLNSSKSGFFLPEWWRAVDRIGEAPNGVSPFRDAKRFEAKFADYPMLCAVFLLERLEEAAPADRQKAKQLLEHADALLMSAPEEETQWHARLLQLRAQLAFRSEALRWAGYVGTAASIFLALGDALRARTARPAVEEEPLSEIENRRARITVELEPDGLRVDALVPPGVSTSEQHSGGRAARLIQAWVGRGRRKSAFELEDWWADDPVGAAKEFGALLFSSGALEALRSSPPATEVRLELEGGRLNFVPWELVRAPDTGALVALEPAVGPIARAVSNDAATREEVRFLQLALNRLLDGDLIVDGMFGPKSGGLLRRYQEHRGVEPDGIVREDLLGVIQGDLAGSVSTPGQPPLVILVQPSAARQIEGTRGMLNLGVDTRRLYETHGFEVWPVESPSLDEMRGAINHSLKTGNVPALLHISGGLRESGGTVAFTFSAGEWYSEALGGSRYSDELPVTAIDDLLRMFARDSYRPLVILDVDRPPGVTETISQLLLRNAFAGDLFALGRCPALIATGLVSDAGTDPYTPLIGMLASGASLGETCMQIRREAGLPAVAVEDLERTVPLLGTALFTHLPWLRPVMR